MVLVQSTHAVTKAIDCNKSYHVHPFILFLSPGYKLSFKQCNYSWAGPTVNERDWGEFHWSLLAKTTIKFPFDIIRVLCQMDCKYVILWLKYWELVAKARRIYETLAQLFWSMPRHVAVVIKVTEAATCCKTGVSNSIEFYCISTKFIALFKIIYHSNNSICNVILRVIIF